MATLKFYLNRRADSDGLFTVYLRLSVSRDCVLRGRTSVRISDRDWDEAAGRPKKAVRVTTEEYNMARKMLPIIESRIIDHCSVAKVITSDMLKKWIAEVTTPEISLKNDENNDILFLEVFDRFIEDRENSGLVMPSRVVHYRKTFGMWDRFEMFTGKKRVLADMGLRDLEAFRRFFFDEYKLFEKNDNDKLVPIERYAFMYENYKAAMNYASKPRSRNYFVSTAKILICVWKWASDNIMPLPNIFSKFDYGKETYGTPWYILPEIRNKLYAANLSAHPELAVQRDIFVFQSLVGCRYGDLSRLTPDNIHGEYLEYIAGKTVNSDPKTIRVPLHPIALEIIDKYNGKNDRGFLLPFISEQKYNKDLKTIFLLVPECDIQVTVLDPKTRVERKAYLHEVASSHMARRNLIGSLKEGGFADEDICAISGHSEGSRAISRYRTISDDYKRKMIDKL